jgi:hypothetical protein
VRAVIREGQCVTPDLNKNSKCGTREMAEAVAARMKPGLQAQNA